MSTNAAAPSNFIRAIIDEDLASGKRSGVVTRFPPEPNGYLHIGHAKSICLNFGLARDYGGRCHLRFDDTNPEKEELEYIRSIKEDVRWLGFDWGEHEYYASDYFEQLYEFAVELIKQGKAYVCHLTNEEMREYRGTLTEPGKDSPYRDRSVEENLELFEKMRRGEFGEGECVLRAKIDMASPNVVMRDPVLYRIKKMEHHRTGDKWVIYPMYDFTHCLSDAIENITHSICTLEFENNRPLYEWILEQVYPEPHPQQIEFARLNLSYTVMSKRKLLDLINRGVIDAWDDPRLPTISGLRRRGYTPAAIRDFCDRIGVAKTNSMVDMALLEHCLREDLNQNAERRLAVLRPLKVVIENYPEGEVEYLEAQNNPQDPDAGTRLVPFSREIYIEREDFMEDPPKKFFRLAPGREVRLRFAYFITCTDVIKDAEGNIVEIRATYDPETKGGSAPDGRKVKGTLHWVSAEHSVPAEVRLYDHLFTVEDPNEGDIMDNVNPNSLEILTDARVEVNLADVEVGEKFQFERQGYFCVDPDSTPERLVFNRTVSLRDTWSKVKGN
ncbi:MAG: glutamine--tRNA ligase/YqeY domain fusion protein [Firmicutes bacterium]|jgi:glutaminyl-tRNA synthetase|nr:glutamine--tRNA ligase/YqeY domain fusion protein [Bacillota bacterium]NLO65747.1 glutamine--tRNA ligase/YqeY domain fusion protein [Bacillota bacterium]